MKAAHLLVALALAAGVASAQPAPTGAAPPPPIVDAVAIVGPPPAPGSMGAVADRSLEGLPATPERVALASRDQAVDPFVEFAPVLGARFTRENYPATARLFAAFLQAAGPPIGQAKEAFQRQRPYVAEPSLARCTPAPTEALGPYRSYPSGHSTLGYGWALLLAEVMPDRAQAILERGVDYGQSRVVCGVHWPSDVQAGRVLGSAVVARVHSDAQFRALIDAARTELANFR